MAEPKEPYDLVPDEPDDAARKEDAPEAPRPTSSGDDRRDGEAASDRRTPPTKESPRKARLDAPRLLDDVDDDADLTHDPEVEAALRPSLASRFGKALSFEPAPGDHRPVFVKTGLGSARVWGVAGGVLAVAAVVAAIVTAPSAKAWHGIYTLYSVILHTGTGVLAVTAAAALHGERLAYLPLAAARVLAAVAAALLVYNLRLNLIDGTRFDESLFAVIAYLLVIMVTFRLWGTKLLAILACHFLLWMAFVVGSEVRGRIQPAAPPAAVAR